MVVLKGSRMMNIPNEKRRWPGSFPWLIIGAVVILFPVFGLIAAENIHRQKENTTRLLLEKGAALIRSFEAGTRTGMHWSDFQLQNLLAETAQQPDIEYLLVADTDGRIVAHSDSLMIGEIHDKHPDERLDFEAISQEEAVQWRIVERSSGRQIFEVYRRFNPSQSPMRMHRGRMMQRRGFRQNPEDLPADGQSPLGIFVGLDMTAVEAAREADTRQFLFMVLILLLVGFSGIFLLFLFQSYRTTRATLSRIKAFSDTLVQNMPIGLVAVDTRNRIASINAAGGVILGISGENPAGRSAEEVLPKELFRLLVSWDRKGSMERIVESTLSNGQTIPLEIGIETLSDEGGNSQGGIMLFKDLSEVKALREAVERNQRLAAVGRLAAGVAHEIRNPLSSIKGFATYFKERYRNVPEDQKIAGIMIQEVDRLNRVVGQLLEFARPIAIVKRKVYLKKWIDDSLKLVERQAAEGGIAIQTNLPGEEAAADLDPDRVNQVLLNLYLNAVDSMQTGGVLKVDLAPDELKGRVVIRVSDTGSGIPEADLAHIFEPYFTTKPNGTGLGLAIAYNIVKGHGGEIHAESRLGEGTTVTVAIPRGGGSS
jgi:two-component system sensor histidine kinase HydH